MPFFLSCKGLVVYPCLEEGRFFHWGVYNVSFVKIKSGKYFVHINGLKKFDCLICSILLNFQAQIEANEAYVYYWKGGCKLWFDALDDSGSLWSYYLNVIYKYTYNWAIKTYFYHKNIMIYVYSWQAKLL